MFINDGTPDNSLAEYNAQVKHRFADTRYLLVGKTGTDIAKALCSVYPD